MSDIRFYMFHSGSQRCKYHNIRMNQGNGEDYVIPVPWFLLVHPKGNIIIDGGLAVEGLADPRAYWGDGVDTYQPLMTPEQGCMAQLRSLGIDPDSIRHVFLSHLHSDHTGAIGRFPNAIHLVQKKEYEYAFNPDWFSAGAYCHKDFDRLGLMWQFLDGEQNDFFDIYGDGVIKTVFTPGHSPGHQSFLITLPGGRTFLLGIDAVYTLDHWHDKALPGFMTSAREVVHSVAKLRTLAEKTNAEIVPGHDPEVWQQFSLAPDWYQ